MHVFVFDSSSMERPVQKSVLRGIFMEWRHQVAWELEQKAWMRDDVCYVRPRCVFRFMLHEPQFKKAIAHLWKCIDMWMCAPEGCAMVQTLHIAVESMPSVFIKMCSYEGACLRRHAGCTRTKGYRWYDPSNYVYAQIWYLLQRYCLSIVRKADLGTSLDHRSRGRHTVAKRMLEIHNRALERWPAVSTGKHYNRLGDLLELVLGRCYCYPSEKMFTLLHIISDIAFWVTDIDHAIWRNQPTQPRHRIAADAWAKGIHWIYELQRHKQVQCKNYSYTSQEEKFDMWASEMNYCFHELI